MKTPHITMPTRGATSCLALAVLLASPVHAADSGAVRSLLEIRHEKVVIQQWDMSCGAAALATILTYQLGDAIGEKQVAQGMLRRTDPLKVKHRGGFSLLDMKRYAESRGFEADGYSGLTMENLRRFAPLIVPVRLEGYDHFVIFRGVAAGSAVLADPAFGNRRLPLAEFEKVWHGNVGFVVKPRDQSSPANRIAPRRADFLGVESESIRAALDFALPAPLAEWQMANMPWPAPGGPAMPSSAQAGSQIRMSSDATDTVAAAGQSASVRAPGALSAPPVAVVPSGGNTVVPLAVPPVPSTSAAVPAKVAPLAPVAAPAVPPVASLPVVPPVVSAVTRTVGLPAPISVAPSPPPGVPVAVTNVVPPPTAIRIPGVSALPSLTAPLTGVTLPLLPALPGR